MPERKSATSKARTKARRMRPEPAESAKTARTSQRSASREREHKPKVVSTTHDEGHFGAAPKGATHFAMSRLHADGSRERLSMAGREGVAVEHFPLRELFVEKLRRTWGPGTYKGQWMCVREGRWTGLGTIRGVRILPVTAMAGHPAPSRRMVPTVNGYGGDVYHPEPAPREVSSAEPSEVVDVRVRAERDIARQRLDFEREMFERRLDVQREDQDRQFASFRQELDELRRHRGSDDDDEPGPWDWIGPLVDKLRPTLEQVLPDLLGKLMNQPKGLPHAER